MQSLVRDIVSEKLASQLLDEDLAGTEFSDKEELHKAIRLELEQETTMPKKKNPFDTLRAAIEADSEKSESYSSLKYDADQLLKDLTGMVFSNREELHKVTSPVELEQDMTESKKKKKSF